jgi:hypothetical protein
MPPPEPTTRKRSAHFGVCRTKLKSLDDGVRKTIANAIQRWQEKRIEFIEGIPAVTQDELSEEGILESPTLTIPSNAPPATPRRGNPPVPLHHGQTQGRPRI